MKVVAGVLSLGAAYFSLTTELVLMLFQSV